MARASSKKTVSMEEELWKSADKLRGSVEPSEYKHVVLSLIFLKYASDRFEEQRKKIIAEGHEKFVEVKAFYAKDNVFYLAPETRWSYLMEQAKQDDVAIKIDNALSTIEKANEQLKGALPDKYYSRLHLDTTKLASLLDVIDGIEMTADREQDIIGRVYEYFLSKFALKEGKGKGEFYTPKSIVNLIAELLEPYSGVLYDKRQAYLIQANEIENAPKALDIRDFGTLLILGKPQKLLNGINSIKEFHPKIYQRVQTKLQPFDSMSNRL